MLGKKTLLTANNLNSAYLSKTSTNGQSLASELTVSGGKLTLKNSILTDNANASHMRIDPQGNKLIVYDGVNNQEFEVYSSSGSEATKITTINGATPYGLIDVTSQVDHLKIMDNSGKEAYFGGNVRTRGSSGFITENPSNLLATVSFGWQGNEPRLRVGGSGTGNNATFKIQGLSDFNRLTLDSAGNGVFSGSIDGTTIRGTKFDHKTLTTGNPQVVNANTNTIFIGNPATMLNLESNATPVVRVGASSYNMWHSGNFNPDDKLNLSGGVMTGGLEIDSGGGGLRLKPGVADHTYIEFYPDSQAKTSRKAFVGFGSSSTTTFTLANEFGGLVNITTSSPTGFQHNGSTVWTSANDGASSGLDADYLDGYHHTSFVGKYSSTTQSIVSDLTISKTNPTLKIYDEDASTGTYPSIEFDSLNNQGIEIRYSEHDSEILDAQGYALIIKKTASNPQTHKAGLMVEGNIYSDGSKVWTSGNDGSGSGLDADLLDGLNSTAFMRTDANTSTSGTITIGTGTTSQLANQTDGALRHNNSNGYIEFGPKNTSYAHIYTDRPSFYFNKDLMVNGNKVWHAGNDGASSGLDADLLDGQNGAYYLDWNNATNKPSTYAPSSHDHDGQKLSFVDNDFGLGKLGNSSNNHGTVLRDASLALSHSLVNASSSDIFRFKPVTGVEYWNGTAWAVWSSTSWKNVLDGTANSWWNANATYKKFRFTIDLQGQYKRVSAVVVHQRYDGGEVEYSLTIEGSSDNTTWSQRMAPTASAGSLAYTTFINNDTQIDRYIRLTFDTQATDVNPFSLVNVIGITNRREYVLNGSGLPFNWNYDRQVETDGTLKINNTVFGGTIGGSNLGNAWLRIGDTLGIDPNEIIFQGAHGIVGTSGAYDLIFNTNGAEEMRIKADGKVGIGTSSPSSMLHVVGGSSAGNGININGVNLDTLSGNLLLRNMTALRFSNGNDWDWNKWAGIKYDSTTSKMFIGGPASSAFQSNASPPTIDILFSGVNRMGVGTDAPRTFLDINGTVGLSSGQSIYIGNVGDSGERLRMHNSGSSSFIDYGSTMYVRRGTTTFLTMTSGGDLTVAGNQSITGTLNVTGLVTSTASNSPAYRVGDDVDLWDINTANTMGVYGAGNTAVGGIKLGSTGPLLFGTGNTLGVGTSTPDTSVRLDVSGSIKISSGGEIHSGYNSNFFIKDHANGHITLSATGGDLYLGYQNTVKVRLEKAMYANGGASQVIDATGKLYYQGNDTDSRYVNTTGDTLTGNLTFSNQNNGIVMTHVSSASVPSYISGGGAGAITGGSDYAGLAKLNNIAVQTWNGFSISPSIAGQTVPIGTPAFSVNARTGDTALRGDLTLSNKDVIGITSLVGQYGTIARSTDEWLRINDDGSHSSGIYFGSSTVRTDGEFQVGSSGSSIKINSGGIDINANSDNFLKVMGNGTYDLMWQGFYKNDGTTRKGWIGYGTTANSGNNLTISNDTTGDIIIDNVTTTAGNTIIKNGNLIVDAGSAGYKLNLGKTEYHGGAQANGDAIYSTNALHLGANDTASLWARSGEVRLYTGPQGSADGVFINSEGALICNSTRMGTPNAGWNDGIQFYHGAHAAITNRSSAGGGIGFGLHSDGDFYWLKGLYSGTYTTVMKLDMGAQSLSVGGNRVLTNVNVRTSIYGPGTASGSVGDIWVQY